MKNPGRPWLVKLRKNQGLSQEGLAEMLEVDVGTVSRWERGLQDIRARNQSSLAEALEISIRHLSDLLAGIGKPIAAPYMGPNTASEPSGPIGSLRSVVDGCRGLDHSIGPRGTLDIVRSQIPVAGQLSSSLAGPNEQHEIVGLTAQIHQLSGWMNFDIGNMNEARTSFAHARQAAGAINDPALLAYILGPSAAFAEADSGDPSHGVDLIYSALGWAERAENHRLLAFVLTISARVHAKLGDELETRLALDKAATQLALHDSWDADPLWLQVFDETALVGHTGSCDLDLCYPEQAVELLNRQDSSSSELFVRNRAIWRLDRATAFRNMNEIDQACLEIDQALDLIDSTSSPRTSRKLNELVTSLTASTRLSTQTKRLVERISDRPAATFTEAGGSTDSSPIRG